MFREGGLMSVSDDDWRAATRTSDLSPWTGVTTFFAGTPTVPDSSDTREVNPDLGTAERLAAGDSDGPYNGDTPPTSMKGEEHLFQRRHDGFWTKPDASGRQYRIDRMGEFWAKRRMDRKPGSRPTEVPPEVHSLFKGKTYCDGDADAKAAPAPCALTLADLDGEAEGSECGTIAPDSDSERLVSDDDNYDPSTPPWETWEQIAVEDNTAPLSSPAVSATAGARIIDPDHVEDHPLLCRVWMRHKLTGHAWGRNGSLSTLA